MRLIHKNKYYNNTFFLYKSYPLSLLKSFKEKWKLLLRKKKHESKKNFFKKSKLKNFLKVHAKKRMWVKHKRRYNRALIVKRLFYLYYQRSFGPKYLRNKCIKKNKLKVNTLITYSVKPMFNAAVLSFFLKLVASTYHAKQKSTFGEISVNGRANRKASNLILKKGDLFSLQQPKLFIQNALLSVLRKTYTRNKKLFLFLEVDYYLRSFVVIKNYTDFKNKEFSFVIEQNLKPSRI